MIVALKALSRDLSSSLGTETRDGGTEKRCPASPRLKARRARNTHRVAITNSRLVRIEGEEVPSRGSLCRVRPAARDDAYGRRVLRRFLLQVLPNRFVRIRYYGLLANRHREKALALCRQVFPGRPAQKIPKTDWRHRPRA